MSKRVRTWINRVKLKIHCITSDMIVKGKTWIDYKRGYIDKEGAPIKCHKCKSVKIYTDNYDYIETWGSSEICEFDAVCDDCGAVVGHWAYGNWDN